MIQVALTPVFLLSGIGTLLNVFSTRLGRVADQLDKVTAELQSATGETSARLALQLAPLRRRSIALDVAVVAAAIAGGATCGATIALFIGALREDVLASVLFILFGVSLGFTLVALCAFLVEMMISGAGLRLRVAVEERAVEKK